MRGPDARAVAITGRPCADANSPTLWVGAGRGARRTTPGCTLSCVDVNVCCLYQATESSDELIQTVSKAFLNGAQWNDPFPAFTSLSLGVNALWGGAKAQIARSERPRFAQSAHVLRSLGTPRA